MCIRDRHNFPWKCRRISHFLPHPIRSPVVSITMLFFELILILFVFSLNLGFYLVLGILPVSLTPQILLFCFLGKESHPFSASNHQYTLYFKKMCQRNDVYKTKRSVRRRPADLVTKENMKEIAQKYVIIQCMFFLVEWYQIFKQNCRKKKLGIESDFFDDTAKVIAWIWQRGVVLCTIIN